MEIVSYLSLALIFVILVLLLIKRSGKSEADKLQAGLEELKNENGSLRSELLEELKNQRQENSAIAREDRQELNQSFQIFRSELAQALEKLSANQSQEAEKARANLKSALKEFQEAFDKSVRSFNELQREKFSQLELKQNRLVESTEKRLDQMRETVDEKLQKTLNERLGQSFEQVGKQLESVQKGLGEMQSLAQDVGGLKRVLSNVKMRGGIGEVQLAMLLENILAPDQYEPNVKTKAGSDALVEFAIKLPGKDESKSHIWLPIDAKFPKEVYEHLQNAFDEAEPNAIELAQRTLEATIKKMAKDISEKYLDPPNTTEFAIMFLPFEGIYAEVVRKASLLEEIQRNYRVLITGPSTLAAILNSLQMGFKTLAIERRSSEVWQILGAVKTEFEKFGGLLAKAQKNIQTGLNQLDQVKGVRTRAIQRKLKKVESLDKSETELMLPEIGSQREETED
jgi:DNA recombination protein RmuC